MNQRLFHRVFYAHEFLHERKHLSTIEDWLRNECGLEIEIRTDPHELISSVDNRIQNALLRRNWSMETETRLYEMTTEVSVYG